MTFSTLTIANKALILCGANTITSLTEDTQNARTINSIYDMSRQEILTECKWSFAVSRTTLSVTVASSTMPWLHTNEAYVYSKPDVGILRIYESSDKYSKWRLEQDYIIADTADLGIKYIFDNTDASKYPPKFVRAFIDLLCSEIAYILLNDVTKAEKFLEKYEGISLIKAQAEDGQTGLQQVVLDDAWENAKYTNDSTDA